MEPGKPEPGKAEAKARGGSTRWRPGQSGNPQGYRKGSRHRATLFAESLLAGESQELIRKVVELAKSGDVAALKICIDRILPPLKSRPVSFTLPALHTASDALRALAALVQGTSSGQLLPEELEPLVATISTFIRAIEVAEFGDRLAALEKANAEDVPGEATNGREQRYDA
jgi:Family of unknown function (DUF5681)